jgi:hypothetical protein
MLSKKKSIYRQATPPRAAPSVTPRQHVTHAKPYTLSRNAVSTKRSSAAPKKRPPVNVSWQNANMRLAREWLMPTPCSTR